MNYLFRNRTQTGETFQLVTAASLPQACVYYRLYHPWECVASFEGDTWTMPQACNAAGRELETPKPLPLWKVILSYCYPPKP